MRTLAILALTASSLFAQQPFEPHVEPASDAAEKALEAFRPGRGLSVELIAAEPHLANPVALDVDAEGRIWVVETHRLRRGVYDLREHREWIDRDLACRTVEDRLQMMRDWFGDEVGDNEIASERIRRIEFDADGEPRSTVFAANFADLGHGIASGVLVDGDDVWFTCLPELWRLRDTDGDGHADEQAAVHRGFGVRFQFIGHDMHGLRIGPDRRLYFSIGDRGLHVNDEVSAPDTGGVLRCELDGSNLELFATGLRNPQELAFDAWGNLFTGDNNSDGGDRARWVYLVEGGDSGWRCGYQWLPDRGPWNREKLWHPAHPEQPAWIVPPIMNIVHGPSGLTYFPLHDQPSSLPKRFTDHFFLCDFRASPPVSGIYALRFVPKGAGFELQNQEKLIWGVCATDVEIAPDGSAYLSDWVSGWGMSGRGRIHRVHNGEVHDGPPALSDDPMRLDLMLEYPDMRVRQAAQFRLVDLGATDLLARVAHDGDRKFGQRHAIWGLGILARRDAKVCEHLRDLLGSGDAEITAQTAKVLGDARDRDAADAIAKLTTHPNARTRFFACQALAHVGSAKHVGQLFDVLRTNADRDPHLRHAAMFALAEIGDADALRAGIADVSPAVRRGIVIALSRMGHADVALLLGDRDPSVAAEAARSIYREGIDGAMTDLAQRISSFHGSDAEFGRRVLYANRRLGTSSAARALATFAKRTGSDTTLRTTALSLLGEWSEPSGRDPLNGNWRPVPARENAGDGLTHLATILPGLIGDPDARVARRAAELAKAHKVASTHDTLAKVAANRSRDEHVRAACFEALQTLESKKLDELLDTITGEDPVAVRKAGVKLLALRNPVRTVPVLASLCDNASRAERQNAMTILGTIEHPSASAVLKRWIDRLQSGTAPADLHLEIVEAADARAKTDPAIQKRIADYRTSLDAKDSLATHRIALEGGDRAKGRKVFFEHPVGQCLRCHAIDYHGGKAGPRLDKIGNRVARADLLKSLVDPSAEIAEGFATEVLTLRDGSMQAGVLASETDAAIELVDAAGQFTSIEKSRVRTREQHKVSSMPPMGAILKPRELRDLVEYLASLK